MSANQSQRQQQRHRTVRIGVWFDPAHVAYGGPAQVLIGTLLGFYQHAEFVGATCVILLNELGEFNWAVDRPESYDTFDATTRGTKRAIGPLLFSHHDFFIRDPNSSPVWRMGGRSFTLYLAPSTWFGQWINHGLPFYQLENGRPMVVWSAGVNTESFVPRPLTMQPKRHNYFIYFKSQAWSELAEVHEYLFKNYFRMHGPTLAYYFYSQEELLEAAQNAEFCIYMGIPETQGLAALEIMATGCPLFVLDKCEYTLDGVGTSTATSTTCWSEGVCGMKSSLARLAEDFPRFLTALPSFQPRPFVEGAYSWRAAAGKLWGILDSLPVR